MKIVKFVCNPFQECTYLVWDEQTLEATVIDSGMCNERERQKITNYIEENRLTLVHLLYTHLHFDHCCGYEYLHSLTGLVAECSKGEEVLGMHLKDQAQMFGVQTDTEVRPLSVGKVLKQGDEVRFGSQLLKVLEVPGHSPCGLAFYCEQEQCVFVGDTLFAGSIGRADLMGGDETALIRNIKEKLLTLPSETLVLPGHGTHTTIEDEAHFNIYLR